MHSVQQVLRLSLATSLCCFLTEAKASITADDFLVTGLEEIDPVFGTFQGQMHAGLLSITVDIEADDEGKLMFWLFEPDAPKVDDSLVIWFNGGPGCSSFHAGLFLEMGPITTPLQPAGSFGQPLDAPRGPNEYAWSNVTTIMYVEQPVGTGFSYGADPPTDEDGVSRDFYHFLVNFNQVFPQHASKRLYLVGESYAGYYVPSMAHKIHHENKKKSKPHVNLQGIALGNGWADVENQGPAVIDYAYWHGMIDSVTRDAFHAEWEHCKLHTATEPEPFHPFTTPDECGMMENVLKAAGGELLKGMSPNTYDVTTWDKYLLLTNPVNTNTMFFNDPRVREKLHVPKDLDKEWAGCMPGAGRRRRSLAAASNDDEDALPGKVLLKDDKPISMAPYIAQLLDEANIQVLIYNGDRDLSTCAQGSEQMLNGMDWSGHSEWLDPMAYRRALWMVDDYPAGWSKSVKNLDFLIVYNSGHLVPYNVPVQAFDLVTRLVKNKPFGDVTIPVVFEASALPQKKTSGGGFLPVLIGFVAGVGAVFAYLKFQERRRGEMSEYEQVGDIETEAILA